MHDSSYLSKGTVYVKAIPFILMLLFISACKINDPEKIKSEGSLSIANEGVSSTEAWLRVKAEAITPEDIISIQRDGLEILSFSLHGKDTLIYEDSLTPGRDYNYRAIRKTPVLRFSSENLSITTMDTTSHDFHFRKFIVCNHLGGLLDVAIINENDIWAVGSMYMNLPEGKDDTEPVGAVHWDGKEWKQVKVPGRDTWMSPLYPTKLSSVIAFASDNVYFSSYGALIKWDGKKFEEKAQFVQDDSFDWSIFDIWGSDEKNIYAVGHAGAIYHYTGDKWHKIESGTDLTIQSVWGSKDPVTGEDVVICVASKLFWTDPPIVFQIKNDKVTELPIEGLRYSLSSVWFSGINKILLGGDGIYTLTRGVNTFKWDDKYDEVTNNFTYTIAGNGSNDFAVGGGYGDICHFNGKTWKSYLGSEVEAFYGNLYGMDMKGNTICAVGGDGRLAIVYLGQR